MKKETADLLPDTDVATGGTHTAPLFVETTHDLIRRLESDPSELAAAMATEARDLAERFTAWATARPTPEERIALIQRLFALNRRAMDHLSRR